MAAAATTAATAHGTATASWHRVGPAAAVLAAAPEGSSAAPGGSSGRLHACIEGRYVTMLRAAGQLTAIDSVCFHSGGPLGLGDIEDVQGRQCLVCPWHDYKIDVLTGEKVYQAVTWQDGRMTPAGWKSNGPRQRVHRVEERADGQLYVQLNSEPTEYASDEYASNTACGARITTGG